MGSLPSLALNHKGRPQAMQANEFDLLADLLYEVSSDLRRAKFATVFTFLFTGDFGLLRRFM